MKILQPSSALSYSLRLVLFLNCCCLFPSSAGLFRAGSNTREDWLAFMIVYDSQTLSADCALPVSRMRIFSVTYTIKIRIHTSLRFTFEIVFYFVTRASKFVQFSAHIYGFTVVMQSYRGSF